MINPNNICYKCMSPLSDGEQFCKNCGARRGSLQNAANQLPIGSFLAGKYLVGCSLGQGGFGITYIGWELNLDRKIAIKEYYPEGFVSRDLTSQSTVMPLSGERGVFFQRGREKFVEEARTLSKFADDPGIVSVQDFFNENGTSYLAMDYVEGKTLKELAKERGGRLPSDEVFSCLAPVMDSLEKVHEAGLLHRDISPDNIMIRPDGRSVLLDFGAARQISAMGEHSNTINVKHGFAPEEQYRTHGEQGPWTDIYALCATIYKLTTGVTPPQAMDRAMSDLPLTPPNDLGANMTAAQQATVMKGLSLRGRDRQQSIQQLKTQLGRTVQESWQGQEPPAYPPEQPPIQTVAEVERRWQTGPKAEKPQIIDGKKRRTILLAAAAGACVLAGVLIAVLLGKGKPSAGTPAQGASGGTSGGTVATAPGTGGEAIISDTTPRTKGDFIYQMRSDGAIITDYTGHGEAIAIPDKLDGTPVVAIDDYAFSGLKTAVEVVIPDGVTELGMGAFYGCEALKAVTIPDSVTRIGVRAFEKTPWLKEQSDGANGDFVVLGNNAVHVYIGSGGSVTVPDGAVQVDFSNNEDITSVQLPNSMAQINEEAFEGCTALADVLIPEGLTSIGKWAFSDCSALERVSLPSSLTSIADRAFYECAALASVSLPSSLENIGEWAFSGCAALTELTIPGGVESMGRYAFYGCSALETLTVQNGAQEIGPSAFSHSDALKSVTIPGSVKKIGNGAFSFCQQLSDLTVAEGVERVEAEAFWYCSMLSQFDLPDSVEWIGAQAFAKTGWQMELIDACPGDYLTLGDHAVDIYIGSAKSVVVPASVRNVDFTETYGIESVVLPEGMKEIGDGAFYFCYDLKSVTIPDSVTRIGEAAFDYCNELPNVKLPSGVKEIGENAFNSCYALENVVIPAGVTELPDSIFYGCKGLKSVTIPSGVTKIGINAFAGCAALADVSLPEGLTEIGSSAFAGCAALSEITIPKNVFRIGSGAFGACDSLPAIAVAEGNAAFTASDGVLFGRDGARLIAYPAGKAGASYAVPDSVTAISNSAFSGNGQLTQVTLPAGLQSFGNSVFEDCGALAAIEAAAEDCVVSVDGVLFSADQTELIRYPAAKAGSSYVIPDAVTTVESGAFSNCGELRSITISKNLTQIDYNTFSGCTALTEVTISDGVQLIDFSAFEGCTALTEVTIPGSVQSIESSAFEDCTALTKVTILSGVKSIGFYAFEGCTALSSITIPNSVTEFDYGAIPANESLVVYCPSGSAAQAYAEDNSYSYEIIS